MVSSPVVPMCQEEPGSIGQNFRIICHDGEIQHHLIHFCIAIPADSKDAVTVLIEQVGNLFGVIDRRNSVAWAVIKGIPQEDKPVRLHSVGMSKEFFQSLRDTVNVREKEQFHRCFSL